jgi:hypothetical protein
MQALTLSTSSKASKGDIPSGHLLAIMGVKRELGIVSSHPKDSRKS